MKHQSSYPEIWLLASDPVAECSFSVSHRPKGAESAANILVFFLAMIIMSSYTFQIYTSKTMSNKYNWSALIKWSWLQMFRNLEVIVIACIFVPVTILMGDAIYRTLRKLLWKEIFKPKYRFRNSIILRPSRFPTAAESMESKNTNEAWDKAKRVGNSLPASSPSRGCIDWHHAYKIVFILAEIIKCRHPAPDSVEKPEPATRIPQKDISSR